MHKEKGNWRVIKEKYVQKNRCSSESQEVQQWGYNTDRQFIPSNVVKALMKASSDNCLNSCAGQ